MLAQSHFLEQGDGIETQNVLGALARIDGKKNCNQSAHDMRVAVADESQDRFAAAVWPHSGIEPNLAGATLHLVDVGACRLVQWRKFPAELDQVTIAVVPIVQEREILDDLVYISHRCVPGLYIEQRQGNVDVSE